MPDRALATMGAASLHIVLNANNHKPGEKVYDENKILIKKKEGPGTIPGCCPECQPLRLFATIRN